MKTLFIKLRKLRAILAKPFCFTHTSNEETVIVLQLRADGSRCAIWNDSFPIRELGTPRVSRASNVKWSDTLQEWQVFLTGHDWPAYSNASRDACIKWEVDFIHANFSDILENHFPQQIPT